MLVKRLRHLNLIKDTCVSKKLRKINIFKPKTKKKLYLKLIAKPKGIKKFNINIKCINICISIDPSNIS